MQNSFFKFLNCCVKRMIKLNFFVHGCKLVSSLFKISLYLLFLNDMLQMTYYLTSLVLLILTGAVSRYKVTCACNTYFSCNVPADYPFMVIMVIL